ncbi:MAG TPA: 2-C-methyl-D-erythritol 2,4-cyclodiphosphate synthase [Rhodothermales bacterium]|nr:2-C-methyl-D-erythritol 2,4-cyclodiphosphate synthase [Rhodothermales bacterium]
MRVGFGYDVHRLVEGRRLILGGVDIPHGSGLIGHSDADVLAHAMADALLGAAALGDIGTHFPNTSDEWRDADSMDLLRRVSGLISEAGYVTVNVDATVAMQRPRLRPFIDAMRSNLASALGVEIGAISVKATTTEQLGFEGREEGVTAYAVCLIERRPGREGRND